MKKWKTIFKLISKLSTTCFKISADKSQKQLAEFVWNSKMLNQLGETKQRLSLQESVFLNVFFFLFKVLDEKDKRVTDHKTHKTIYFKK